MSVPVSSLELSIVYMLYVSSRLVLWILNIVHVICQFPSRPLNLQYCTCYISVPVSSIQPLIVYILYISSRLVHSTFNSVHFMFPYRPLNFQYCTCYIWVPISSLELSIVYMLCFSSRRASTPDPSRSHEARLPLPPPQYVPDRTLCRLSCNLHE